MAAENFGRALRPRRVPLSRPRRDNASWRNYLAQRARSAQRKSNCDFVRDKRKPGGKLNSPPGLKLGVVTPKAFGVVMKRGALMPLSLCFFLGSLFAFFCHRLFPPFNPQMRRVVKSSR